MGPVLDRIFVGIVLGGIALWVAWGWRSWIHKRPTILTAGAACSLIGFTLASVSASAEIGMGAYAQFHSFAFMDPILLRIYRIGFFTALPGLGISGCGMASKSPLRWKSPALSTVLLLLWIVEMLGE